VIGGMRLPNRENAYIHSPKLTEYLLSETHRVGRFKARVLLAAGFDETNLNILEQGLIAIALESDVVQEIPSGYGTKYVIDGLLETPSGITLNLRTIWIIDAGETRPRLVTAYPV